MEDRREVDLNFQVNNHNWKIPYVFNVAVHSLSSKVSMKDDFSIQTEWINDAF